MEHPVKISSRASHRGMSLVEVTLAVGITAFVAITLMGLMAASMGQNGASVERDHTQRIFRHVQGSINAFAQNAPPLAPWSASYTYTREAIECDAGDPQAFYRADCTAKPTVSLPGNTASPDAWGITIQIYNIPQAKQIYERGILIVKEPFEETGEAP